MIKGQHTRANSSCGVNAKEKYRSTSTLIKPRRKDLARSSYERNATANVKNNKLAPIGNNTLAYISQDALEIVGAKNELKSPEPIQRAEGLSSRRRSNVSEMGSQTVKKFAYSPKIAMNPYAIQAVLPLKK